MSEVQKELGLARLGGAELGACLAAPVALFNVYNTRDDLWLLLCTSYVMAIPGGQVCGKCGRTPYLGTTDWEADIDHLSRQGTFAAACADYTCWDTWPRRLTTFLTGAKYDVLLC
jgi:hypothetical protein